MMELPRAVFMWIDVRLVFPKVEASSKSENEAAVRSLVGPVTVRDKARIVEMLAFTKEFNAQYKKADGLE